MTYLIGEIGQNHNGSVDIAKLIIDVAARSVQESDFDLLLPPLNAVKLTRRDLNQELSASQMKRPYTGTHSFGKTYGEHRAFLELSDEQHHELFLYARERGLEFVETLCATGCLSLLKHFTPHRLKVASRDLTNIPLLEALAETGIPLILSTGMAGKKELDAALETIVRFHENVAILHCVSQYPTAPSHTNLRTITYLQKHYPRYTVGYSDHTIGISAPVAAVAMGAQIVEKHITLDRQMKGTDQAGSLGIDGIRRMVRDVRLMELSLGKEEIWIDPVTAAAREKLERSLATKHSLPAGSAVRERDLHLLSPGNGFKWAEREQVIGKKLARDIDANEVIYPGHLVGDK